MLSIKKMYSKVVILTMICCLSIVSFGPQLAMAKQQNDYEREVEELSNALEFVFNEAITLDAQGAIIDIDSEKIKEKYGDVEGYEEFKELDKLLKLKNKEVASVSSNEMKMLNTSSDMITIQSDQAAMNRCVNHHLVNEYGDIITGQVFGMIWTAILDHDFATVAKKLISIGVKGNAIGIAANLSRIFFWTCGVVEVPDGEWD